MSASVYLYATFLSTLTYCSATDDFFLQNLVLLINLFAVLANTNGQYNKKRYFGGGNRYCESWFFKKALYIEVTEDAPKEQLKSRNMVFRKSDLLFDVTFGAAHPAQLPLKIFSNLYRLRNFGFRDLHINKRNRCFVKVV